MTSITAISDAIIARLQEISGPRQVDDWGGEIDSLIQQAAKLPALYVVYSGARFDRQRMMSRNKADYDSTWTVVVIDKNLRGQDAAAPGCYTLIEAVRDKLIGFDAVGKQLWPDDEQLIFSDKGKLAYALTYSNRDRT